MYLRLLVIYLFKIHYSADFDSAHEITIASTIEIEFFLTAEAA